MKDLLRSDRRSGNSAAFLIFTLFCSTVGFFIWRHPSQGDNSMATVENDGPRGTSLLFSFLVRTKRGVGRMDNSLVDFRALSRDTIPILTAPNGVWSDEETSLLRKHLEQGGRAIWAVGPLDSQPALEKFAGLALPSEPEETLADEEAVSLFSPRHTLSVQASHALVRGLRLTTRAPPQLRATRPQALTLATFGSSPSVVSIAVGRGELLLLSGTALMENFSLNEGDNLSFWTRLSSLGTLVFDEFHHHSMPAKFTNGKRRLSPLFIQSLLAGLIFAWGVAPRFGPFRPPHRSEISAGVRGYLDSLGLLYRRARAERELAARAIRALKARVGSNEGDFIRFLDRVESKDPGAALSLRQAVKHSSSLKAGDGRALLELCRAIAQAEMVWSR